MQFRNAEEQLENSDAPEPKFFTLYFDFLLNKWGRMCILIWWLIVIIIGCVYGRKLLDETQFIFYAPSGTRGYTDDHVFKSQFKTVHNQMQILVYYHCTSCNSKNPINSTSLPLANMSSAVNVSVWEYGTKHDNIFTEYQDYYTAKSLEQTTTYNTDYFNAFISKIYFNGDFSSMLGVIGYNKKLDHTTETNMLTWLEKRINKISKQYKSSGITVAMTGQGALIKDMSAESKEDVEKKDVITIPVALCVLGVIVRSWRLMLIPIICVFTSLMASFSIMNPIATNWLATSPFAPSIMMSVTVAMSIDYSLFLLTRFREEVEKMHGKFASVNYHKNVEIAHIAIRQMTRWSGKVVALSGTILSLTYFALVAYPMNMLQSVGLGAGIAIVCTIIVNLSLTPALLLTFPNFFSTFGFSCRSRGNDEMNGTDHEEALNVQSDHQNSLQNSLNSQYMEYNDQNTSNNNNNDKTPGSDTGADLKVRQNGHAPMTNPLHHVSDDSDSRAIDAELYDNIDATVCERCWYRCGFITTLFPWSLIIIVVVYGLISPIGWRIFELKKQLDDTLIFPRDSDYFKTYTKVEDDFSAGMLAPFYLLIPSLESDGNNVYSESYFNHSKLIMTELYETVVTDRGYNLSLYGINVYNDRTCKYYQWNYFQNFLIYQYLATNLVSSDNSSSYYSITTSFDPFNNDAFDFLDALRGSMDDICDKYGYKCYLTGGSVDEVDTVNKIFDSFPAVLAIIICVIFCLMGIFFYSVFVPIRLFLTITVPMSLVYGLSILVYQKGLLKWMHWSAVADTDGLYWLIPVMTVTILVGLALDYDIFLFARIYEYRAIVGMPTRQAIIHGVYNTGSIITAAGCIMAIAFSGLLMSEMGSLNQTGFILVVAVLVDTFIIRTMLVPAVLSMAKEVNWWPGLRFGRAVGSRTHFKKISLQPDRPLDETM